MKQITCDCCNAVNTIAERNVNPICDGCCKPLGITCLSLKATLSMRDVQNPYCLDIGSNLPIFSRKPLTKHAETYGNYIFSDSIDINSLLVQINKNELTSLAIFFTKNDFQELNLFVRELLDKIQLTYKIKLQNSQISDFDIKNLVRQVSTEFHFASTQYINI